MSIKPADNFTKHAGTALAVLLIVFFAAACVSAPLGDKRAPSKAPVTYYSPAIMGQGNIPCEVLASFLLKINSNAEAGFVHELADFYISEAEAEGVNHDTAFAQMCLETGYLRYGGQVDREQNNFCGLGALDGGAAGASFDSPKLGVRAHIQHLKAYATTDQLKNELVDPRYRFVEKGISPLFYGLTGAWATDPAYADKIEHILVRLHIFMDS